MKFTHNNNEYELIMLHTAGSRLYGNSTPESDWDYRGVFIASPETKLGILGTVEQLEGKDVYNSLVQAGLKLEETDDIVIYELNRFVKLAIENNPNIMDTLCYDYTNPDFTIYVNDKGKELIDNKGLFISSKLKFTFSGYAISQLARIKGHGKWLSKYPFINDVYAEIKEVHHNKFIDFDWICDNFGGQVAEKVTGETPQKNTKLEKCINWDTFKNIVNKGRLILGHSEINLDEYRIPRLINYCYPKDLKGKRLNMNSWAVINSDYNNAAYEGLTIEELLKTRASFRSISPSMLIIYTEGKGIFSKEGNLKANDPEHIGEFVCLLSIDQNKYKSDKDYINNLWQWKCNRNNKRNELEEKYGYDTKHASHLVRLMQGVKDILMIGTYNPTLSGDRLQLIKDVRAGCMSYDEIIKYSESMDKELDELYKTTKLQKKPEVKKINELVIKLQS